MSLLNLIVCCQWENSCLNISISLGCLSLSNFESKQVNVPTPPCKKKTHIDSIDRWLSAFAVYCTVLLTSFPPQGWRDVCLSRDNLIGTSQAHRVCMTMLLYWFFSVCGCGDHFSHGCSLSALRPTSTCEGVCHNFNCGTKSSQDPSYQARPIKSSQTAEVLQPYMYKPHTPTNVPFLHNLLKSHPIININSNIILIKSSPSASEVPPFSSTNCQMP